MKVLSETKLRRAGLPAKVLAVFFMACLPGLLALATSSPAQSASTLVERGNRAFAAEDYDKALQLYDQARNEAPESPYVHYNLGNAYYRLGKYDQARAAYEKSAELGKEESLLYKSRHNLGNTAFRKAGQLLNADPQQARESLDQSMAHYRRALEINPQAEPTAQNIEIVKKTLRQLERLPQQQGKQSGKEQQEKQQSGENLQNLINRQQQLADQTDRLAQKQRSAAESSQANLERQRAATAEQQQELRRATADLQQQLNKPENTQTSRHLENGLGQQKMAERQLAENKLNDAARSQKSAATELQKALEALGREQQDKDRQNGPRKAEEKQSAQGEKKDATDSKKAEQQQKDIKADTKEPAGTEAREEDSAAAPDTLARDILEREKKNSRLRWQQKSGVTDKVEKNW